MRWWVALSCLVVMSACGHEATTDVPSGVSGTVVTSGGHPLEGAVVTVNDHVVTSGPGGAFTLTAPGEPNTWTAVRIKAPGFPEAVRRVLLPRAGMVRLSVALAPIDQSRSFQIPTGTQKITFNVNHGFAAAKLTIPGDSLVNPRGEVVSGSADINLTFWAPDDNMDTIPGPLRASRAGDPSDESPVYLLSYGMVDIDVRQNGEKLQVAPGKTLDLVLQTNAQRRDALANRPANIPHGPTLWTLNPNTGVWDEDVGDSTYDVTTGELIAVLRHLSTKNSDEPFTYTGPPLGNTGCIQGRALGACGQALPNAQIRINVIIDPSGNATAPSYTYVTDSTGHFKENFAPGTHNNYFLQATWSGHTTDMTQSPHDPSLLFLTDSRGTPAYPRVIMSPMTCSDKSGSCQNSGCACFNDPTNPGGCMDAIEAADPAVNGYNPCWVNPLGSSWIGPCFDDVLTGSPVDTHYNTVWNNWTTTDLCGNCWPLLDAVFKDVAGDQTPGCTGAGAYGTGCCPTVPPPGAYNICDDLSAAHRKLLGQNCETGVDTCCPVGSDPPLLCSDYVCVPVTDASSQP